MRTVPESSTNQKRPGDCVKLFSAEDFTFLHIAGKEYTVLTRDPTHELREMQRQVSVLTEQLSKLTPTVNILAKERDEQIKIRQALCTDGA